MWLQSAIRSNRRKSFFLVLLFPVFLFGIIYLIFLALAFYEGYSSANIGNEIFMEVSSVFVFLGPIIIIWWLISFFFHRQMIFSFSGAKPVTRKDEPEIYNIVENLCISRGLPTPKIGIIEDDSLNAFAVGRDIKHAWIVFSRGIINKLNRTEIEAVAGHELTHIINKDSLLMIIVVVFIGIIGTLGEILLRIGLNSRSSDNKDSGRGYLIILGLVLLVLGYVFYPLIQLAISRKREYLADAGSVQLTKDKLAMISALEKISADPVIESIEKQTVAAMCIQTPFAHHLSWPKKFFTSLLSTHPLIEDRIKALENY